VTLTVEIESRRRLFLGSVLPFTVLLAALVAVPRLAPGGVAETYRAMLQKKIPSPTVEPAPSAPCDADTGEKACETQSQVADPVYTESHRRSALGVVDRWERERRQRGGLATISTDDLMRLRRALL
jgi:hypothetical protein